MPPHQGYTLPAPTGGLNLIDRIDAMPENDAMELVNIYPSGSVVSVRGGLESYSEYVSDPIRSLYPFNQPSGTSILIGCTDNKLVLMSSGTGTDNTGSTTPTSDDWQSTQFGSRIWLVNGVDSAQYYTGAGSFTDSAFTGVTSSTLVNVSSYKERIYFVKKNTTSVWYGGLKSVSGALTEFDTGYNFKKGGHLVYAGSWTNQQASTSADLFFLCSSEGELLFYSGSYPGDSSWSLVARYEIGRPMSYRSFVRVDNDMWIITDQGIYPISLLFSGGPTVALNSVARKVNSYIRNAALSFGFGHLWHGMHWSRGNRVYIVVPDSGSSAKLLVCNIETGAWCLYEYNYETGAAISLALLNGEPYAGSGAGKVRLMENNDDDDGENIIYRIRMPFNFYGSRGNFKKFLDIRPLLKSKRGISFSVRMDTDFKQGLDFDTISTTSFSSTPWGSPWGSAWSGATEYLFDRYSVRGQGHCGALRIQGLIKDAPLDFNAFEVRYEVGGQE